MCSDWRRQLRLSEVESLTTCRMRASSPNFGRLSWIRSVHPDRMDCSWLAWDRKHVGLVGGAVSPVIIEDDDGRSVAEKAEAVARTTRGTIQNDVSEYLTLP